MSNELKQVPTPASHQRTVATAITERIQADKDIDAYQIKWLREYKHLACALCHATYRQHPDGAWGSWTMINGATICPQCLRDSGSIEEAARRLDEILAPLNITKVRIPKGSIDLHEDEELIDELLNAVQHPSPPLDETGEP